MPGEDLAQHTLCRAVQCGALALTLTPIRGLPSFLQHNQADIRSVRTSLARVW